MNLLKKSIYTLYVDYLLIAKPLGACQNLYKLFIPVAVAVAITTVSFAAAFS
jgi:hypothetical protein